MLKEGICERYPDLGDMPKNQAAMDRLVQAAVEVWEDFQADLFTRLVDSMVRRLEAVIEANVVASATATVSSSFYIQVQSGTGGQGVGAVGRYVVAGHTGSSGSATYGVLYFNGANTSSAVRYYIDESGRLRPAGSNPNDESWVYLDNNGADAALQLRGTADAQQNGYTFLDCAVNPDTRALTCSGADGMNTFLVCSGSQAYFALPNSGSSCGTVTLIAVQS
ncbi:hypothetical protein CONLIGDRAFT_716276 [Coniochaeta ligniaria NRRL 30616]|uniref:Uncharacterized protein n=1 Tax=Coniochaeta ligniaria NRRL 30616 TaxID=1408157 RepID=A0A1J7IKE7_9PEZI|nr:hypothetical protein CONLIGDRAFT_716276 [Coniochaeta ligniaria NRRL 30616]